jgi:ElaB/YqjD/DUF883 family membrane-anchored ribosome-binding protein
MDRYEQTGSTQPPRTGTGSTTSPSGGAASGQFGSTSGQPTNQPDDMMGQAKQKGQEAFDQAKEKSQQAAGAIGEKTDQGLDKAADAAHGLAQTLRERADSIPGGQQTTDLAYQAASGLERGADYLRQADVDDMRGDLEGLIRRYPTQSIAVGLAVGFLIARAFR